MIQPEVLDSERQSYGRCISKGHFIEDFYETFLGANPDIKVKFANTDFEQQYHLLKHGLNLLIMFSGGNPAGKKGLARIQDTHRKSKLNIEPGLYPAWKKSLLETVASHDRLHNEQVSEAWGKVLDYGIAYIQQGYEA